MKGVRNVVREAHDFVRSHTDETGCIPADRIFGMGHSLAHCGMQNILTFLEPHGFKNIGHFVDFIEEVKKAGYTPENTNSKWNWK